MKRFLILSTVLVLLLSSCNLVGGLFNPIVGTWNATIVAVNSELVFNADGSTTETNGVLGVGVTKTGSWSANDVTITRTWSDSSTSVDYYWFSTDKSQMTLSKSSGGISTTYTKK